MRKKIILTSALMGCMTLVAGCGTCGCDVPHENKVVRTTGAVVHTNTDGKTTVSYFKM